MPSFVLPCFYPKGLLGSKKVSSPFMANVKTFSKNAVAMYSMYSLSSQKTEYFTFFEVLNFENCYNIIILLIYKFYILIVSFKIATPIGNVFTYCQNTLNTLSTLCTRDSASLRSPERQPIIQNHHS